MCFKTQSSCPLLRQLKSNNLTFILDKHNYADEKYYCFETDGTQVMTHKHKRITRYILWSTQEAKKIMCIQYWIHFCTQLFTGHRAGKLNFHLNNKLLTQDSKQFCLFDDIRHERLSLCCLRTEAKYFQLNTEWEHWLVFDMISSLTCVQLNIVAQTHS